MCKCTEKKFACLSLKRQDGKRKFSLLEGCKTWSLRKDEKIIQKLYKRKLNGAERVFSAASSRPLLNHEASFQNCETALTSSQAFPGMLWCNFSGYKFIQPFLGYSEVTSLFLSFCQAGRLPNSNQGNNL